MRGYVCDTVIRGIAEDGTDAREEVDVDAVANTKPASGDLMVCYPCREGLLTTITFTQHYKVQQYLSISTESHIAVIASQ